MFLQIRSFTRHKRFLMRLVIFMLLICLVPIGVLGVFFYHNVQNSMRKDIEQTNERYLNQTVIAMELVVKQIGNGFRQFVTSSTVAEFDLFPLGNYFDEIGTWQSSPDKQTLLNYIISKSKVQINMESLMQLSDFIFSVYYVNPSKGIVLTSGSLQYEIDRFYDSDWNTNLQSTMLGYPIIMNVRNAKQEDGTFKRVVPVVFRPIGSQYTVVINLDADTFYTNLISRLEAKDKASLIVFSRDGEPLLYDNDSAKADGISFVQSVITKPENATGVDIESHKVLVDRQLVSWRSSDMLGWKIVSVTSLHEIYSNVSKIRNLFFTVSILLAIATAILAVMTSRRLYRPISYLLQFISEGYQRDISGKVGNRPNGEFRVISESLADAYETRKRLQLRLRESIPAYQEKFVRSLLKKNTFNAKEIEEQFEFLGIGLMTRGIVPMVVSTEVGANQPISIEIEKIEHLLFTDSISSAIDPEYPHWMLELEDHVYLVLVNCGEKEMSTVFAVAESVKNNIAENHDMACTIGIGTYCQTISELPQAYKEAAEALQYRSMTTGSDVIYIEDVRLHAHDPLPYSKEKEATLIVCLKNGEKDQALALFAEMVRDLRSQSGKIAFPQVQQAFLSLLVRLIETIRDLHLDIKEFVPDERSNLLAVFLQKDDWREMTLWFEYLISATAINIGQAFQEKKNTHIEHAKRLIETESASALSLTMIADLLKLNPAYLSRIFKEYTGVTFTDYVTQIRVQRSKELLLQTEMKVKDISEQIGYAKVTHYIKLFKDMNGITPGEFRKQHN